MTSAPTPDPIPGSNAKLPASLSLGVIGNCAFSALIDAHGRLVWSCLPRFDGDPVFNALLDDSEKGSDFAIELEALSLIHI